ncbi:MAG TPA: hypothetical protein VND23_01345, partial [Acidimicrobiales bacterium]|nr:hypothetical protein [Acidimicrobiales bacterium]
RGLRLLSRVPHVSSQAVGRLVSHFGDLHRLMRAPAAEIADAAGIDGDQARLVKDGLVRLAESNILDRTS